MRLHMEAVQFPHQHIYTHEQPQPLRRFAKVEDLGLNLAVGSSAVLTLEAAIVTLDINNTRARVSRVSWDNFLQSCTTLCKKVCKPVRIAGNNLPLVILVGSLDLQMPYCMVILAELREGFRAANSVTKVCCWFTMIGVQGSVEHYM